MKYLIYAKRSVNLLALELCSSCHTYAYYIMQDYTLVYYQYLIDKLGNTS